ncbi:MAG: nicotinate-nucleotide--dimethylbenzimidazole phosphoribosyltransferase [Myxococcota bacterium]
MQLPSLRTFDEAAVSAARAHLDRLTKPPGSLGKLEDLVAWWCGATGYPAKVPARARVYTFAGDHGVTAEGVSPYPSAVTVQMVRNFLAGGAAVNVFARHHDVELGVVDVGVAGDLTGAVDTVFARFHDRRVRAGTGNMVRELAMTRAEAEAAVNVGIALAMEAAAEGVTILGAGEMGIGNTTSAAAVLAAVAAMPGKLTAGRGTGVDDAGLARKVVAIDAAIARHDPGRDDGIGILSAVGGFEIAAIAGLCIGGAATGVPVILDGFISTAGGLVASVLAPDCVPFFAVSHRSAENAHWGMCRYLRKEALHDLDMKLGEGTGAVLGIDSVRLAAKVLGEMATFASAGISDRSE